jgi:hypothetical protein
MWEGLDVDYKPDDKSIDCNYLTSRYLKHVTAASGKGAHLDWTGGIKRG